MIPSFPGAETPPHTQAHRAPSSVTTGSQGRHSAAWGSVSWTAGCSFGKLRRRYFSRACAGETTGPGGMRTPFDPVLTVLAAFHIVSLCRSCLTHARFFADLIVFAKAFVQAFRWGSVAASRRDLCASSQELSHHPSGSAFLHLVGAGRTAALREWARTSTRAFADSSSWPGDAAGGTEKDGETDL